MSEHELEKLLGGFAADTLTPEEKQQLFTAALQDQRLFDALADEQALKELLADPAVRRRLLQSLNPAGAAGAGGSLSWLDWFKRPAHLALAGGLATAAFALVLGTKMYQDSLTRSMPAVATEEARTAAPPPASEPQPQTTRDDRPAPPQASQGTPPDKPVYRDRTAPGKPERAPAADVVKKQANVRLQREQERVQDEAPVALGKTAESVAGSADRKQKAAAPTAPASELAPTPSASAVGVAAPAISARALFYGGTSAVPRQRVMADEQERAAQQFSAPPSEVRRTEPKKEPFAAAGASAQVKPLGLRYSFTIRDGDEEREVDAATALKQKGRLTIETNQEAYVQVWKTGDASTAQLIFPDKDTGRMSMKLPAGQRHSLPLPTEAGTVTVLLSLVPLGPITRQEVAMLDRPSPSQIQETVSAGGLNGSQEEATYVVSQDPSPAQFSIPISFFLPH